MIIVRNMNKWAWLGLAFIVIGLIVNAIGRNMSAFGWGIATLAWFVVAELMRQQYESQQKFVQELLAENARLHIEAIRQETRRDFR